MQQIAIKMTKSLSYRCNLMQYLVARSSQIKKYALNLNCKLSKLFITLAAACNKFGWSMVIQINIILQTLRRSISLITLFSFKLSVM